MMNTTLTTSNLDSTALSLYSVTCSYTITSVFHYFLEDALNDKLMYHAKNTCNSEEVMTVWKARMLTHRQVHHDNLASN